MAEQPPGRWAAVRKVARFVAIYGPGRTWFKAAARLRLPLAGWSLAPQRRDVGLIGCGQFAFATIGYFLQRHSGHRVLACHDVDAAASRSLARALGAPHVAESGERLLDTPGMKVVYVVSNHASHADYAVQALARGLDVHVEKPVAVSHEQLVRLERARRTATGRLVAGYNRPFSAAMRELGQRMRIDPAGGFSMQCFVAGHRLGPDHWYRRPEEGTRICGNVGHWLDLWIHLLAWRGLPDRHDIQLAWADDRERDDNVCVSLASDRGDVASILLSARAEPFEGINESIQVQHGETLAKIDDFRRMTVWRGEAVHRFRYWPKDVGHGEALMQVFGAPTRDWSEVEVSTLLMLHIADMVRAGERTSSFSTSAARAALARAAGTT